MKLVEFVTKRGKEVYINPDKVASLKANGENATIILLDATAASIIVVAEDLRSVVGKLQA